jgi:hypothetical protein
MTKSELIAIKKNNRRAGAAGEKLIAAVGQLDCRGVGDSVVVLMPMLILWCERCCGTKRHNVTQCAQCDAMWDIVAEKNIGCLRW